jgi:hypothetical protein
MFVGKLGIVSRVRQPHEGRGEVGLRLRMAASGGEAVNGIDALA